MAPRAERPRKSPEEDSALEADSVAEVTEEMEEPSACRITGDEFSIVALDGSR